MGEVREGSKKCPDEEGIETSASGVMNNPKNRKFEEVP